MAVPNDHLPATLRDRDFTRRAEAIEALRADYRHARSISAGLRAITDQQSKGQLTRSAGFILAMMVRQNVRACARREATYRPTRRGLARLTGYSQRTVSTALSALKAAGLVVSFRYSMGGRQGDNGTGLATEWRAGCLQFLPEQLVALGYRLPKTMVEDLRDLAEWAARQVGERTGVERSCPLQKPTGKKVPTTMVYEISKPSHLIAGAATALKQAPDCQRCAYPPTVARSQHVTDYRPGPDARVERARLSKLAILAKFAGGRDVPRISVPMPDGSVGVRTWVGVLLSRAAGGGP